MSRKRELGGAIPTVNENMERLDKRLEHMLECQLAHWEERADTAARGGGERDPL